MGSLTRKLRRRAVNEKLAELGLGSGGRGAAQLKAGLAASDAVDLGMSALANETYLVAKPRHIWDDVIAVLRRWLPWNP